MSNESNLYYLDISIAFINEKLMDIYSTEYTVHTYTVQYMHTDHW